MAAYCRRPIVNVTIPKRWLLVRRTALPYPYGSCNLTFMKVRKMMIVVFLNCHALDGGLQCPQQQGFRKYRQHSVWIDLTKVAPMGYEISGDHPLAIDRGKLILSIRLPEKFEIPPDQQKWGAKAIVFKPGDHDLDLYKDLTPVACCTPTRLSRLRMVFGQSR